MPAEVIELGAHDRMTVEEAFAAAAREPWDQVIIVGFHIGRPNDLVVRSSGMTREDAMWITKHLELHCLGKL